MAFFKQNTKGLFRLFTNQSDRYVSHEITRDEFEKELIKGHFMLNLKKFLYFDDYVYKEILQEKNEILNEEPEKEWEPGFGDENVPEKLSQQDKEMYLQHFLKQKKFMQEIADNWDKICLHEISIEDIHRKYIDPE